MSKKRRLDKLPIKIVLESSQTPFIILVDKILAGKKVGEGISVWESEIDAILYTLYGLTPEEITMVEGQ